MDTYAVADDDGIVELHLGPVTVTWSTMGDRVNVRVTTASKSVEIYASPAGRNLRVYRDHRELM